MYVDDILIAGINQEIKRRFNIKDIDIEFVIRIKFDKTLMYTTYIKQDV